MARKSTLSFVFDPDGSGCNIHIAGHDTVLRFAFGRLGAATRELFFQYGVKQKLSDVTAGDLKAGAKPADLAREIERRIHAAYNGQFNMRAAGQMFGDMVEAAFRIQRDLFPKVFPDLVLDETELRAESERKLLGMAAGDRERWAKKPLVASVIAQVVAERMATVAENAEPIGDDLFDI